MQAESQERMDCRSPHCFQCPSCKNTLSVGEAKVWGEGLVQEPVLITPTLSPSMTPTAGEDQNLETAALMGRCGRLSGSPPGGKLGAASAQGPAHPPTWEPDFPETGRQNPPSNTSANRIMIPFKVSDNAIKYVNCLLLLRKKKPR